MNKPSFRQKLRIILAIAAKDSLEALKNRTILALTLGVLVLMHSAKAMPLLLALRGRNILAVYDPAGFAALQILEARQDMEFVRFDSQQEMKSLLVDTPELVLGLVIPVDVEKVSGNAEIFLDGYYPNWASPAFMAGVTGIVTDAFGIGLVALAPIPILQKISITCAFWSIATIIFPLVFTPVVLSYMPESRRMVDKARELRAGKHRDDFIDCFMLRMGAWIMGGGSRVIMLCTLLLGLAMPQAVASQAVTRSVTVAVYTKKSEPVADLVAEEVSVAEDGKKRTILSVVPDSRPHEVAVGVDSSVVMASSYRIDLVSAVTAFWKALAPDSRVAVWTSGPPSKVVAFGTELATAEPRLQAVATAGRNYALAKSWSRKPATPCRVITVPRSYNTRATPVTFHPLIQTKARAAIDHSANVPVPGRNSATPPCSRAFPARSR